MPTGKSMTYVGGGDRMPPLTPIVYGPPRPKPLGLNWTGAPQNRPQQPQTGPPRSDSTPGPKPHPETSLMIRLYVDDQLTAPQVAAAIGCAAKTVRTNLRRAGVTLRDDRTGQNLPKGAQ